MGANRHFAAKSQKSQNTNKSDSDEDIPVKFHRRIDY